MGILYKNIMRLCEERGIKGGKMCTEIGMSKGILTDLKMGRQASISPANARKIADYFGVSIDYLFRDPDDPCCTPDDENPYELELRESFDTLDVDDQIYVKNWVCSFAQDPERAKKSPLINDDQELTDYLEMLKTRPECRMLFQLTKNATKEDVEVAVRIIEALRNK